MTRPCEHRGATLLELTITMTILAIITAVAVLAVRRFEPSNPADPQAILADSLRAAVTSGADRSVRLVMDGSFRNAAVHADGSIVADSALDIDRLAGVRHHAR